MPASAPCISGIAYHKLFIKRSHPVVKNVNKFECNETYQLNEGDEPPIIPVPPDVTVRGNCLFPFLIPALLIE